MQRRELLKTAGTVGATGLVTGGAALALTGGASATAGGSISDPAAVTSDDGEVRYVAVMTTGRLTWDGFDIPAAQARILVSVDLKQSGSVVWSGQIHDTGAFSLDSDGDGTGGPWGGDGEGIGLDGDHAPGQAGYIASDADWGILQQDRQHIYDPENDDTLSDGQIVAAGNGYPLPEDPGPTSYLTANTDGGSQDTRVILRAEYRLYDSGGNELTGRSGYPSRPTFASDFVVTVNNQEATTGSGDADAEGQTADGAKVGV